MAYRKSPAWEKERALYLRAAAEAFEAMDAERPIGVFETLEQRETRAVALGLQVARTLLQGDLDGEGETVEAPRQAACPDCHQMCDVVSCAKGVMRENSIVTHAGEVSLKRALYRCSRCRRSFFPSGYSSWARI